MNKLKNKQYVRVSQQNCAGVTQRLNYLLGISSGDTGGQKTPPH